jgi:hypothetical protein
VSGGDIVATQNLNCWQVELSLDQDPDLQSKIGAGEGIRTLDFNLGKVALYP